MNGPLIRNGGVTFSAGKIIGVGDSGVLLRDHPNAEIIDRPDCIVLPGLINAHTHLELSEFKCSDPPSSFVDWVKALVPRGQTTADSVRQSVTRSIPIGVGQCLRYGVTCVGDISRHCAISRPLLRDGPLRVVSYGEVQAMAQRRVLLEERLSAAIDQTSASQTLRIGLTPHAPYSIEADGYRQCLKVAKEMNLPLATHLAETLDESVFLSDHSGPFRDLWDYIGAWDESAPRFEGGPIRFAHEIRLLDYPTLLAHVNYCDDEEMELLARGEASVVYCPRTHAFFGHQPHRWRRMLEMGINVAVGTDSCASSPDLNLLEELRLLRRIAPDVPAMTLWEMTTARAARAIRIHQDVGTIERGKMADFDIFPAASRDPLEEILSRSMPPIEVWIGGSPIDGT